MSPELTEGLKDKEIALALKRLYNYKRLRELLAPPVVIEQACQLLEKSKVALGNRYSEISAKLFVEFQEIEDATFLAEQNWEKRCQSCRFWTHGYNGRDQTNTNQDQWCGRHSFETRTIPDECPDYQPRADGDK